MADLYGRECDKNDVVLRASLETDLMLVQMAAVHLYANFTAMCVTGLWEI